RALDAHQRRLVGGHRNDHRMAKPVAEIALDELAHFPAPFPHQCDHVHVGARVARHHAEERALADTGAGEDAEPLPAAAGAERVQSADAEVERLVDRPAIERIQAPAGERVFGLDLDRPATVERAAEAVEDAAEHAVADAYEWPLAHQHDAAARGDAGE